MAFFVGTGERYSVMLLAKGGGLIPFKPSIWEIIFRFIGKEYNNQKQIFFDIEKYHLIKSAATIVAAPNTLDIY